MNALIKVIDENTPEVASTSQLAATQPVLVKASGKIKLPKRPMSQTVDVKEKEPDLIVDLVHEIENLSKEDAVIRFHALDEKFEQTYFEIGGVLSVFQKNKWFDPYATFDLWVEKELGMKRSKARALTGIYDAIANSGVSWAQVKNIGWTKLRPLTRVLNKDNAEYWVNFALDKSKIVIIEAVKQHMKKTGSTNGISKATHPWNFKLHDDQNETIQAAIDKAMELSKTSHPSAAFELICLEFLGTQSLSQRMKTVGVEKALIALQEAFPDGSFEVFVKDDEDELPNA